MPGVSIYIYNKYIANVLVCYVSVSVSVCGGGGGGVCVVVVVVVVGGGGGGGGV